MEKLIVERIEGAIAVLEKQDLSHTEINCDEIGFAVSEGDVLLFDGKGYVKDTDEASARRKRLLEMQEKLKKKSNNT